MFQLGNVALCIDVKLFLIHKGDSGHYERETSGSPGEAKLGCHVVRGTALGRACGELPFTKNPTSKLKGSQELQLILWCSRRTSSRGLGDTLSQAQKRCRATHPSHPARATLRPGHHRASAHRSQPSPLACNCTAPASQLLNHSSRTPLMPSGAWT